MADAVFAFYKSHHDTLRVSFEGKPYPSPPIQYLSANARAIMTFCCKEKQTRPEIGIQYDLFFQSTDESSACRQEFLKQFSTRSHFISYVDDARISAAASQGWRIADITNSWV